jgi:pimeloyl-ACP methyl ester carboxylesterase
MPVISYPTPSADSLILHRCRVHAPADGGRHPVLFLLHGVDDSEDDWDDVSRRKGAPPFRLPPNFPAYVVLPYCKPRNFPNGEIVAYPSAFPDVNQFVRYFEDGLVESLRRRYPEADWDHQAIGGVSMGGYLAFEIASRRAKAAASRAPFRCIGLFSAALHMCDTLISSATALASAPPKLLHAWLVQEDHRLIIDANRKLASQLRAAWFQDTMEQGKHNWVSWRPQLQRFLAMARGAI